MKGDFWWTGNLKILKDYKDLATVLIRNGQTCQLWEDNWSDIPAKLKFPEIFSFTKNKIISVSKAKDQIQFSQLFHLPLSDLAHSQMINLANILDSTQLTDECDSWGYVWGSNIFAATKAYKKLIGQHSVHLAFRWLWKTFCQPKHKVFFWLLLRDRLSTRNILKRKKHALGILQLCALSSCN